MQLQPLFMDILDISLEIINCEKGIILMMDPVTKEYHVQVSVGYNGNSKELETMVFDSDFRDPDDYK